MAVDLDLALKQEDWMFYFTIFSYSALELLFIIQACGDIGSALNSKLLFM